MIDEIRTEAQRIEEDATYSSCGHFEASKPWANLNLWLGIPVTLASAAAGISALNDLPTLASIIAFAVAAGTALMTFLAPTERHKRHADCGNAYAALRNEVRIFRQIECTSGKPVEDFRAQLTEFDKRRNDLNASSPIIPERAFQKARHGIEQGQKTHRADQHQADPAQP
ncbi:MAG: SLATT domain-containing protein [Verrucomicrobiae bacterium]|nr:SLATT domain-containing protein [Verrucomicrobiae bacterium]